MRSFRCIPFLCAALIGATSAYALNDVDDEDIQLLREFIDTKRQETLNELARRLAITGEVRSDFQAIGETVDGIKQRGRGGEVDGAPSRAYAVKINLMVDYRTENTWGSIKLKLNDSAGTFSPNPGNFSLERAYFGVRYLREDTFTSDVEIGRRPMGKIFDSRIEFGSRFDGVLFKYDQAMHDYGDIYLHAGVFVVNQQIDQYGYVAEAGFLNIGNTGAYVKYSIIDWDTKDVANRRTNGSFRFVDSQILFAYQTVPPKFGNIVVLYSAFLINHAAERREISNNELANLAGYFGFSLGQLRKKGDWGVDANYQIVEAQAIPSFDISGIGIGNSNRSGFYTTKSNTSGDPTTRETAGGNGNYRGFMIMGNYLLTDNLLLTQSWQQSITFNTSIGPFRRFKQFEIEFIYAF